MKGILTSLLFFTVGVCSAQQNSKVDFVSVQAIIEPIASEERVKGTVRYTFKALRKTDSIYLDAASMDITEVTMEGIKVVASEDKIWLLNSFEPGEEYTAFFSFEATPRQTLYFTGDQIWTQGQGKYTSHWLPSIDDMNDKIVFDLQIVVPNERSVIANGKLIDVVKSGNKDYWQFDMQKPMSSYLVAFALGNFDVYKIHSQSGVPIELYYESKDSLKFEPTYRHTSRIFDFLESEIGVPYPWQNYKQVPIRDFLYAGMENTTATFFSEAFVVDSIGLNDRSYVNVNAHELAHQWFGNLVTETEGKHHWLHEGFATYYALLAEKEIFGEDYYYWKLFQSAEQLKALSDQGKGESLLDPKASSLTFYEKGAWALHILKELVGEAVFRSAIRIYLEKYQFKNVNTEDFLAEVRAVSGQDLVMFKQDWLVQSAFNAEQAYESLIRSSLINNYFEISALSPLPLKDKLIQIGTALTFPNDYVGQEAIYQLSGEASAETISLYRKGFDSNNLFVRQAIALSMETIPKELQNEYESLLDDASYVTREAALYNLWVQFPERRKEYLDRMEAVVGFQNKNVRQLWLVLAILDIDYRSYQSNDYISELKEYSAEVNSFEIRELAFGYIRELQLWDDEVLRNLVNASQHHSWRFRKFARQLLDELWNNELIKVQILKGMDNYTAKEQEFLKTKLSTK